MGQRGLEPRDRVLAPCAILDGGELVGVDAGQVIRRLLLFEECVLDWFGKGELATLVETFGAAGFVSLLDAGALRIRADGWAMGQTGQSTVRKPSGTSRPLPPGTFVVAALVPSRDHRKEHVQARLDEIRQMQLPTRVSRAVRLAIVAALVDQPPQAGLAALEKLASDVGLGHHAFAVAAAQALGAQLGREIPPGSFAIRFTPVDRDTYAVETDLGARFGLDAEAEHKLAERALLAVATINQRLEEMETYQAVMGFRDHDLPVFDEKLRFLGSMLDPTEQEGRFERVVTVGGLPDVGAGGSVDAKQLLKIRESEECREFRSWLRTLDRATDDEIRERVQSLGARLAGVVHGTPGKAIRFAASTGLSFIPGTGGAAGIALDALDTFLLEKLVKEPGPITFLTRSYPSIFRD